MSPHSDSTVDDGFEGQHTALSTRSLSSFDFDETDATDSDDISGQQAPANDRGLRSSELDNIDQDDAQASHVPYVIEWKLTTNNRTVTKDSEHNITITPQAFWERHLKEQVREVLKRKLPSHKTFKPVDSDVVVSTTDRSQRDLVKRPALSRWAVLLAGQSNSETSSTHNASSTTSRQQASSILMWTTPSA
ncbi:hypothetical protein CSOJ01_11135 [Colletotrichum sojae]|uniref:Uncharacterized protein n=1 Tax=Colletotrichum sojae TaxID=2175907 RepID=A0A8H6MNB4_9PEZI|nr:hypothetical protein CSOJ01_11135 [Colletotrichum sojae]